MTQGSHERPRRGVGKRSRYRRSSPPRSRDTGLYRATRAEGVGNTALAGRLGLSEGAVRRLLDLDHRSHIGQIETALEALGRNLTVAAEAA